MAPTYTILGRGSNPNPLRYKGSVLTNRKQCPTIGYCESASRLSYESAIILSQTIAINYPRERSKSQLTYLAMPDDKMADWSTPIRVFHRGIKTERISGCKSMNQKIKEPAAGGIGISDAISMAILIRKP